MLNRKIRMTRAALAATAALIGTQAYGANLVSPSQAFPISAIYYDIAYQNSSNTSYKASVVSALRYWEERTNVTFISKRTHERSGNAAKSIRFQEGPTTLEYCKSNVGAGSGTAVVTCNIPQGGSLRHEIGHALGFYHEHSRSDRSGQIYVDGCPPIFVPGHNPELVYNWEAGSFSGGWGSPQTWEIFQNGYCPIEGNAFGSYDRTSLMHYPRMASTDFFIRPYHETGFGWQTYMDAQSYEISGTWMTGSSVLSSGDIAGANYLYPVNGSNLYRNTANETYYGSTKLLTGTVKKILQSGNRIGALMTNGDLYVKEGVSGTWAGQMNNVVDFDLEGDRIGVLLTDLSLRVKEGALSDLWVPVDGNVTQFELEGNRIGSLRTDKNLYVKEGGLSDLWVPEIGSVKRFHLEDERIGVLQTNNVLQVKEGGLGANWVNQIGSVNDFKLEDDFIMVTDASNVLLAKLGGLSAPWKSIGQVSKYYASNGRIAILWQSGNLALTKPDFYNTTPQSIASGITGDVFMHGPQVGYITSNGGALKTYNTNTGGTSTVVSTGASTFNR